MLQLKTAWLLKIIVKIILARIPFGYQLWRKLGIFRHGKMDDAHYVVGVFERHINQCGLKGKTSGLTILELGPGDSIATAILANCYGAKTIIVDAGDYAIQNVAFYQNFANKLNELGINAADLSEAKSRDDILKICNGIYLTEGLSSLKKIDDNSIDMIFSHAVLEHIRKSQFMQTLLELSRVLKPDGVASHCVDLRDHLGGGLNNLRINEFVWESEFFANSGFYTNRILYTEMNQLMMEAGFITEVTNIELRDDLPISRGKLSKQFKNVSDIDLLTKGFDVIFKSTKNNRRKLS